MTAEVYSFRGQHRLGYGYHARDVVAAGRHHYSCVQTHVSGEHSIPGIGAHWGDYWQATDGFVLRAETVSSAAPHAADPAPPQLPATLSLSLASVPRPPRPAPVSRHARAAMPAALPADEPPAASHIPDDSAEGALSVAVSLDALRQQARHFVRVEQLDAELAKIRDVLERTLAGIRASVDADDPITAEAWRRKAKLLGATCRADAQAMETAALRQCLQLLRKRDRGGSFTTPEALQAVHLDNILAGLADIDAVAEELRLKPPADPSDDLHWRRR